VEVAVRSEDVPVPLVDESPGLCSRHRGEPGRAWSWRAGWSRRDVERFRVVLSSSVHEQVETAQDGDHPSHAIPQVPSGCTGRAAVDVHGGKIPAGGEHPCAVVSAPSEYLVAAGFPVCGNDAPQNACIVDITATPARPPAPRSARLATMARAETGALINQWYRNILGPDGYLHEVTLGEVRHSEIEVNVLHPLSGKSTTVGYVRITEVEAIEDLDGDDEDRERFDAGFGACLGHNERKAIAMANLDIACHRDAGRTSLEQSILMTTDGLDSAGFLEHLKLPHYVTFRSMVDRKFAVREARLTRTDLAPRGVGTDAR